MSNENNKALQPDEDIAIPRTSFEAKGITGLKVSVGRIMMEQQRAFRYPNFNQTITEMRNNPTIGSAMNVYNAMLSRPNWQVRYPENATDVDKARTDFINQCLGDMDMSFSEVIKSIIPFIEYGYAILEVVPRRRLRRKGSKFNDGFIGIGKLSPRFQETIYKWNFDDVNDNLISVTQRLNYLNQNSGQPQVPILTTNIDIPREKLLIFSHNMKDNNPEGQSIYKNIYLAYKQLNLLQDQQMAAVARDAHSTLKIEIPAEYMAGEDSPDQGATLSNMTSVAEKYKSGEINALVLPQMLSDDGKERFKYELLESKSSPVKQIQEAIQAKQDEILQALNVDILRLGTSGGGSFALADAKTSVLALTIDSILREIQNVLNSQLIPLIYKLNGWEQTNLPRFHYEDVEDVDIDSLGAFIQRVGALNLIEADRSVFNRIREVIGVAPLDEDAPIDKESLPSAFGENKARAGESMTAGSKIKDGVSGKRDNSTANKSNAP